MAYTLDRESHKDLHDLLEDSMEFFCDEYRISGELAWLAVLSFATVKVQQFRGNTK